MLHVTDAKYINDYSVWLSFDDGAQGTANLKDHLKGPIFEELRDLNIFKKVMFSEELSTITWPNGADLAPEFLRDIIK
jgi:hypothetical protein